MSFSFGKKKKKAMGALDYIAFILIVIGAINWGLVGVSGFNLVTALTGSLSWLARTIYVLVGIAGIYGAYIFIKLLMKP